jgi:hypothetical protein
MPIGGVDHHARWLIHHDQVLVLIDYVEGQFLSQRLSLLRRRQLDSDALPRGEGITGLGHGPPYGHPTQTDETLNLGAGESQGSD